MKTTRKDIENLITRISEITGIPTEKKDGQKFHLGYDFNPYYGGYRLVMIENETGGQFGALGGSSCEERLTASKFEIKLRGIIAGLTYKN